MMQWISGTYIFVHICRYPYKWNFWINGYIQLIYEFTFLPMIQKSVFAPQCCQYNVFSRSDTSICEVPTLFPHFTQLLLFVVSLFKKRKLGLTEIQELAQGQVSVTLRVQSSLFPTSSTFPPEAHCWQSSVRRRESSPIEPKSLGHANSTTLFLPHSFFHFQNICSLSAAQWWLSQPDYPSNNSWY